eukprot:TRINITY_DN3395_c0_g1_i4.p1 TRINITY_DN3395_c0_g1~~TRINITY_DN3395_c0_g1_i4.p1  ORF type:complete len:459 (+),score=25.36 TRINITY_DN3395_c0_g1_i4:86-1378(+)
MAMLFLCLSPIARFWLASFFAWQGGVSGSGPDSSLKVNLESKLDTMTREKRHHLQCYLKHRFMKKDGTYKHCCLPPGSRHSSCAIVSSSGALLKRNYAKEIDAHRFVVRFNDAPVSGYEAWVGSKYSLRAGWNQNPIHRKQDGNNTLKETYFGCDGVPEGKSLKRHTVECSSEPTDTIRAVYPNLLGHSGQLEKGQPRAAKALSTGASIIFMALTSCKEIVLYELIASDMAYSEPYHYYGKSPGEGNATNKLPEHIYWGAEHDLWARLANEPISEIRKTGKATITGLSEIKHCPDFRKESPFVVTRPYHVAPLFEPTWLAYDLTHKNRTEQSLLFHKYGERRDAIKKPELGMVVIGVSCFCFGCMMNPRLLFSLRACSETWKQRALKVSVAALLLLVALRFIGEITLIRSQGDQRKQSINLEFLRPLGLA